MCRLQRPSRSRLLLCGVAALVIGCRAPPARRPSVDDLLRQAVAAAESASHTPGVGWTDQPVAHASPLRVVAHQPDADHGSLPGPDFRNRTFPDDPFLQPPFLPAPAEPRAPGAQARVSEVFHDTDVREAIQALAAQARVPVVIDERVAGLTSAVIEDQPFEAALRQVLLPLGCVTCCRQGQFLIGIADPDSALFPLMAERIDYHPRNLSPQELAASVPERYKKYLRLAEKRNRMLIEAPADLAAAILAELQRADQPVPQVVLEARVCVFSPEARLRFGLDVEHGVSIGVTAFPRLSLQRLALAGTFSPIALAGMFSDFAVTSVFLQLLAQEGYVDIRAAPRVMARDGEKAQITIARETFFSIQPNAEILFRQDIQKVEAGITLDILPIVRGDMVTVGIERAEVSEDIRGPDEGRRHPNDFPVINRRWVSTTVHVKDGQTIVIGGLTHRQVVDRVSKVPYVGELPWLGRLFTRIEKDEQDAEIVIFLAPRIVRAPPEGSPAPLLPAAPFVPPEPYPVPPQPQPDLGFQPLDDEVWWR